MAGAAGAVPLIPVSDLKVRSRDIVQAPATYRKADDGEPGLAMGPSLERSLGLAPLDFEHFGTDNAFYCL